MTRTEKIYYLVFAMFSASWSCVAAVYAVFLLDRGLGLFEINLVLATFFLASFLLEVPTGALADLFGRKISFLASCWALLSLAALVGSAAAARAAALPRRGWVLALCAAVRSVTVLVAAWSPRFVPALAGVVGQSAAAGASEPLLTAWVNDHVDAAQRATVLSVHAMSFLAGGSLGLLVLGYFARSHGIAAAWTVAAAVFALCAVACAAMREETRARRGVSDRLTIGQAAIAGSVPPYAATRRVCEVVCGEP